MKGLLVDELGLILWFIWTTRKSAIKETPFRLVNGSEVVLLVELTFYNHHVPSFQEGLNKKALSEALSSLPMVRGDAYLKEEIVKT